MAPDIDTPNLHEFLKERARAGQKVTETEIADRFGVTLGAVKKRFGLLTGHMVLEETETRGEYDCRNVLRFSLEEFASAGSQGKANQQFVRKLFADIARLEANNESLRANLEAAHRKLKELGVDEQP